MLGQVTWWLHSIDMALSVIRHRVRIIWRSRRERRTIRSTFGKDITELIEDLQRELCLTKGQLQYVATMVNMTSTLHNEDGQQTRTSRPNSNRSLQRRSPFPGN